MAGVRVCVFGDTLDTLAGTIPFAVPRPGWPVWGWEPKQLDDGA